MTTMGVVFAVINLIAVVLLIFKFRETATESASASGDLPGWASDQIKELKDTLKNESADAGEIKTKLDALNTTAMKLGEIMYKQNPQTDQGSNAEKENASKQNHDERNKEDENVVDADFEEVDSDSEKKSN